MKTVLKQIGFLAFGIIAAIAASNIQRFGPDHGIYCDIGKINGIDVYCPKPKLNGGWPAPYLFDKPGISVEGKLTFIEDDFRIWPFTADVAFYLIVLQGLRTVVDTIRRRRKSSSGKRSQSSPGSPPASGEKP